MASDSPPPTDRTYHIRPVLDGQTLAAAVRHLRHGLSWADARRLITGRHVQVNGNLVLDEARRLKAGDVVRMFEHPRAAVPTERDVRVRHIDAELLVVEKPAGMTTLRHAEERNWAADRKQRQPTLDEVLQGMLPGLMRRAGLDRPMVAPDPRPPRRGHPLGRVGSTGAGKPAGGGAKRPPPPAAKGRQPARGAGPSPGLALPRVRAVHRLDRDTSGLMIFALSPRAEQALVSLFKGHHVRRAYSAVAHGRVEACTIESYIVRDRGDGLRGSTPRGASDPGAKRAVTHVKPVEHLGDQYTVLECRLETGRTHQIRIHLAERGHMLCGERIYTRPSSNAAPVPDRSGAPRHALHSAELEFVHPVTGETLRFASPMPKDLAEWVQRLRGLRDG